MGSPRKRSQRLPLYHTNKRREDPLKILLAWVALLAVASADDCHDRNIDCSDWAEEGECDSDDMRDWMAEHCPVSCRKCKARPRAPSRAPTRGGEL